MKPIIEVEGISKRYNYSANRNVTTFREELHEFLKFKKRSKDTFLALEDISFNVNSGESIGIIGSNGAGKSTLLKILSGITAPTGGTVTVRGSVKSILEVGTGFHTELTGRENIFLNGALQGLSRRDIKRKFDEIVDFSGIEKFIDTPFKHYSSGMQVRLAFAIISHIESDVLITDEVLAVGDAAFQKKSLKKMRDIFNQGRTIIFVSHQESMISSLTKRCLLIEGGRLIADGPTPDVIKTRFYQEETFRSFFKNEEEAHPAQFARLLHAGITDAGNRLAEGEIMVSESYKIFMEFEILQNSDYGIEAVFQIKIPEGYLAFTSHFGDFSEVSRKKGRTRVECTVPGNLLSPGQYYIDLSLISRYPVRMEHFSHHNCLSFAIGNNPDEDVFSFYGDYTGLVRPKLEWSSVKI